MRAFNSRTSRFTSVSFSATDDSSSSYTPRPRRLPRMSIRSEGSADRNRPYWSCMMKTQDLNVRASMPSTDSISSCVSRTRSLEISVQTSSFFCSSFSVGEPVFRRLRVTRNRSSPSLKVNRIEPDFTEGSFRIQPARSPSRGSSYRASTTASINRLLLPTPFSPFTVQN